MMLTRLLLSGGAAVTSSSRCLNHVPWTARPLLSITTNDPTMNIPTTRTRTKLNHFSSSTCVSPPPAITTTAGAGARPTPMRFHSLQRRRMFNTMRGTTSSSSSAGTSSPSHPPIDDLTGYYHIEVSNADVTTNDDDTNGGGGAGATCITVKGPDVDGILASMTVALAMRGCSLVSLHAAFDQDSPTYRSGSSSSSDTGHDDDVVDDVVGTVLDDTPVPPGIHDVFYVVDRMTGKPFRDDQLYDLAKSLLDALKSPMMSIVPLSGVAGPGDGDDDNTHHGGDGSSSLSSSPTENGDDTSTSFSSTSPPPYKTIDEQITIIPSK